jgi:hypothetical protein
MEHRPFVFNIHGITTQSDLVIFAEVDQRQEIATKMEISSKAI